MTPKSNLSIVVCILHKVKSAYSLDHKFVVCPTWVTDQNVLVPRIELFDKLKKMALLAVLSLFNPKEFILNLLSDIASKSTLTWKAMLRAPVPERVCTVTALSSCISGLFSPQNGAMSYYSLI